MKCIIAALLIAGTIQASADTIDQRIMPGCTWTKQRGYDCWIRKWVPLRPFTPQELRRFYGPPPDWRHPPVRCFDPGWRDCGGEIG